MNRNLFTMIIAGSLLLASCGQKGKPAGTQATDSTAVASAIPVRVMPVTKTTIARTLTDDGTIARAFRDGIAWVDGCRDPEEEVTRLCLGFRLEREPGERWVECWRPMWPPSI